MFLIDISISHKYHFNDNFFKKECDHQIKEKIGKTSLFVFLGISIHNFPEGVATMVSIIENIEIRIVLAIAIALHNIPEGIAVAIPAYVVTNNKSKSFFLALFSGLSEPIGAIIFGLILMPFVNSSLLATLLAMVGGIMVYISVDELLPISHCFGNERISMLGIVLGMFIIALSLSFLIS
ncbi:MAG: ZIP family metal transporter [Promethearchaeota archaeon]